MTAVLLQSLQAWWPEAILSLGALSAVVASAWTRRGQPALAVAWISLVLAAAALWKTSAAATDVFFGMILCDSFSMAFRWLALAATALVLVMAAAGRREVDDQRRGEYFALFLFAAVGLMLMAEANHLLMAYLSVEMVSLSSYLLVGLGGDRRSSEAAMKYLLFGALASAIMLFGMSLLFGLTGALSFEQLSRGSLLLGGETQTAALLALSLVLAGLAFKISLVPFHQWTPDVYEGAPVAVTAFLSVGPKAAGLALLIRLLSVLGSLGGSLIAVLAVLAMVTMTVGNVIALVQTNVKRLLAYSTIGQVGYMLMGLAAANAPGREALLIYLIAYLFMNLGAFACVAAVFNDTGSESLESFKGLSRRAPGVAFGFAVVLLSLAGLPPLFGFVGKYLLFGAVLAQGYAVLAVVAALNSAIALYYYAQLIRQMYFSGPAAASVQPLSAAAPLRWALALCAAATLVLGLYPAAVLQWLRSGRFVNLL